MATREKTVVFTTPLYTSIVADLTTTNLSQISLYIPETSPTFTSVYVEVGFSDIITATGGTITEHRVGLQLGAAGYTTITETDDIAQSGENIAGVIGPFDYTSHFNTNWTGTSMTCDLQVYFSQSSGTTLGMRNVSAIIYVTYTYDDNTATNATQIKTVRIPFESTTSTLPTTSNYNFGTIPQMTGVGGILPENSVTIRDFFFVIEGNSANSTSATDFILSMAIDSGTAVTATTERALATSLFIRFVHKPTSVPTLTTTHILNIWSSVASFFNHLTVELFVTYEFNAAATTQILVSQLLPIEIDSPMGATTSSDASRVQRSLWVQEPGTITLKNSGFRLNWNYNAPSTSIICRAGSQAYRTYTVGGSVMGGMCSLMQRIDSGSAQGAALTITRGKNTLNIDAYSTHATQDVTNINGYVLLNYIADVPSEGIGAAAHTVYKKLYSWDAALTDKTKFTYDYPIPETEYFILSVGVLFIQWVAASSMAVSMDIALNSDEDKGAGWQNIYQDAYVADAERACSMIWMSGRNAFKRFPTDVRGADVEDNRYYRLFTSTTTSNGMVMASTYHSITYEVGGTLSGNAGSGDIELSLYRDSTGELMQRKSVAYNTTSYTFTVYDDTENYFVVAKQDDTHQAITKITQAV